MNFEELFVEWQESFPFSAFIKDGIVDPESYESPHILFVLRDMNCKTDRNLCDDLKKYGSGWKTWNNIGRWTKALLDDAEEYPVDMREEKRKAQLRRIAVMNLKKEGGGSRTNGGELFDVVKEQHDFIYKEICLCNPELIICCGLPTAKIEGNAELLYNHVFKVSSKWQSFHSKTFDRVWRYYTADVDRKEIPVIGFCHPQVTVLEKRRGHNDLFMPLYQDMRLVRKMFLKQ